MTKLCKNSLPLVATVACAVALFAGCHAVVETQEVVDPITGQSNTVTVPHPAMEQSAAVLVTASRAIPTPWSEIMGGLLVAITGAVSAYAHQKNKHNARLQEKLAQARQNGTQQYATAPGNIP